MIRAAFLLAAFGLVALTAVWFADHPGQVAIDWREWRIETSVGVAAGAVALVAILVALLYRLWRWIRTAPRRLRAAREERRRMQGYRALTRGMVAVAAGDAEESLHLARRAEALLEEPPLTLLLSAQAAQLNGDERAAEKYFRLMLANPELEFLGLRGMLSSEMRQGDAAAALEHARRAYRLRPGSEWIQSILFELQLDASQWKQADALLTDVGRRGGAGTASLRRRRAILLLEHAAAVESAGDRAAAAQLADRAHQACVDFVPAAIAAARLLAGMGRTKRAHRVLEATWRRAPHPDLAAAVLALNPAEAAPKRVARAQRLNELSPGHAEAQLAIARAAIDGGNWPLARRTLESLGNDALEARVCRLWAELEDAEHGPGVAAREWLARTAMGPPDPGWTCSRCAQTSPEWRPACPYCRAFDSLQWRKAAPRASAVLSISARPGAVAAVLARPGRITSLQPSNGRGAGAPAGVQIGAPEGTGLRDSAVQAVPPPPDVPVIVPGDSEANRGI